MGLLDDAIREHLELKRRRGADPGEVAREQREALVVDGQAGAAEAQAAEIDATVPTSSPAPPSPGQAGDEPVSAAERETPAAQPDQPVALGETAELDMSSVLGDDQAEAPAEEDSLEWEVPSDQGEAEAEPEEDVLEETPEFLRDTPEQDRLWFEQRPPRDFDFDK